MKQGIFSCASKTNRLQMFCKINVIKIWQNLQKSTCIGASFLYSCWLRIYKPATLLKKSLRHSYFHGNFAKIFWKLFWENASGWLILCVILWHIFGQKLSRYKLKNNSSNEENEIKYRNPSAKHKIRQHKFAQLCNYPLSGTIFGKS